ncbi:MAG: tyrosine-type recombinase/integrase [Parcubacteria group bacterium]|jgi:integrase
MPAREGCRPAQPITDEADIQHIRELILSRTDNLVARDYLLFSLGLNSGLRGCDLVRLRLSDLVGEKGVRKSVRIKMSKTKKPIEFRVNDAIKEALARYLAAYPLVKPEHYLFFTTLGNRQVYDRHLSTPSAGYLIRSWCHSIGLEGSFGSHTLRKTVGYQYRVKGVPFELIQAKLGHSAKSVAATWAYLGITAESVGKYEDAINL